jgi:hypothetical protein
MAGTPEEDLLGWLEREEESLGFSEVQDALGDIDKARALLYDELGYDITESQFEALSSASTMRYEELPSAGITYDRVEQSWGYQDTYRDIVTGRFVSAEDVFSLLSVIRGL